MAQSFSVEVYRKTNDDGHWETIHEWVHELRHAADKAQEVASREKARTRVVRSGGTVVANSTQTVTELSWLSRKRGGVVNIHDKNVYGDLGNGAKLPRSPLLDAHWYKEYEGQK